MLRKAVAVVLALATLAYAQGNTFKKVRYNGGTISTKVGPKDWNNTLTITSDDILFKLKDGQQMEIKPKLVTSLSYGQEAHRRVGTMIALGILVSPVALFGLFHKTRLHFIGMEYTTPEGKKGGLLMQGDKDNYRAILVALRSVTGVPVSVSDKERESVPVGVKTTVAKEPANSEAGAQTAPADKAEAVGTGTVLVISVYKATIAGIEALDKEERLRLKARDLDSDPTVRQEGWWWDEQLQAMKYHAGNMGLVSLISLFDDWLAKRHEEVFRGKKNCLKWKCRFKQFEECLREGPLPLAELEEMVDRERFNHPSPWQVNVLLGKTTRGQRTVPWFR